MRTFGGVTVEKDERVCARVVIDKYGGPLSSVFIFFLSISALALVYFAIRYTHRPTSATFGYFLSTRHVNVRGV